MAKREAKRRIIVIIMFRLSTASDMITHRSCEFKDCHHHPEKSERIVHTLVRTHVVVRTLSYLTYHSYTIFIKILSKFDHGRAGGKG